MSRQTAHLNKADGFTLIEMMIVIAIIAILAGISTNISDLIEENRARTGGYELMSALNWARSEALKRNNNVRLVAADDEWEDGWTIEAWDSGTSTWTEIGVHDALSGLVITTGVGDIVYNRQGRISSTVDTFNIDISSTATPRARCVSFDLTGRPSVKKETCP